jgi:dephospho-CoA kinase
MATCGVPQVTRGQPFAGHSRSRYRADMKTIGLAGPAGSGKSAVARALSHRPGVAWVDLDRLAWSTYEPGTAAHAALVHRFGPEILGDGGRIHRTVLAERAFADPVGKGDLERIVHPAVSTALARRIDEERRRGRRLLLVEGALLGTALDVDRNAFDAILWLEAPAEVRAARLAGDGRAQHADRTDRLTQPEGTFSIDADAPLDEVVQRVWRTIEECPRVTPPL